MSKFNNMSVQQIIANIEDLRADIHENAKKICEALVELRRLRVKHPLHEDKVFSWFEKIASGRLHYGVVEMFNGRSSYGGCTLTTPMGGRINAARKAKGFTLDQLAEKSGCSKSYIWELENKNPPRPSADKLASIAEALGTTVDVLIGTPINNVADLKPEDKVFFRKFSGLDPAKQDTIRKMIDLWDD